MNITTTDLLENICPPTQLKMAFNQLNENKPNIPLINGSDSAAVVHQVWTEENLPKFINCEFTVDSNLYTPDNVINRGVFLSIRKLNFRVSPNNKDQCIDYVRFTLGKDKTQKICGSFDVHSDIGKRSFFNDGQGHIKVHVFVDNSIPLNVHHRALELDLVFTAYSSKKLVSIDNQFEFHPYSLIYYRIFIECSLDEKLMRCDKKIDDDFCISTSLRRDNIINCPPPLCTDEVNKCQQSRPAKHNAATTISQKWMHLAGPLILVNYFYYFTSIIRANN